MKFLTLAALAALSLAIHSQPATCQGIPCIRTTCNVGIDAQCGPACRCARTGPGPIGACVN